MPHVICDICDVHEHRIAHLRLDGLGEFGVSDGLLVCLLLQVQLVKIFRHN
jgi:hypothetical protein